MLGFILPASGLLRFLPLTSVQANSTAQAPPLSQPWTNTGLITANDNWSNVPGIEGYFLNSTNSTTGIDPQTVLTDTFNGGTTTVDLDVIANQTSTAITNGGVAEFHTTSQGAPANADPTIALQGSGTADAPFILLYLNTTGKTGINVSYSARDIDCTTDNAVQQLAFQYRVGSTGSYTNVPAGFVADATSNTNSTSADPANCTQVTPVSVTLPAAVDNQALVQVRILTTNAAGNDEWIGIDGITVVDGAGGATPTNPSGVGAANPSSVSAGSNTLLTVTVTPGSNPTSTGLAVSGDLSSIGGSATQQFFDNATNGDVTAGDNIFSFQATVAAATTPGAKNLPVTITDAQARTGNTNIALTVTAAVGVCGDAFTPIFQIQGSSTASPKVGETHSTEGVVTADFQGANQQSGFYIQDPSGDGNTATSDGVFVFSSSPNVSVGDRVRVTGQVTEFNTMTEINNVTSTQVCSTGNPLPAATTYDLPEPVNNDLERVEGMLVTFPEALTVTGNNLQGRFGEVMLASDGRLFQPTNFNKPGSAGAVATASLNARRQILLDDASGVQNPNPIPYIGADNTLRAGDTVSGLTGVIDYGLSATDATTRDYRLQPTVAPSFVRANPRPAAPAAVGGTLRVSSANVLNYFNGDGAGGGFPTARGADTAAEFTRQRDKIIAELTTLNADVLGIIEMENDGFGAQSALQDLINGLNAATAPGTFVGIDSPNPGTDLIKNAIIYKPAKVTPVGAAVNDVDPAWDQARPPLAQTFQQNSNGEKFTFIVNHFTSKGCSASDTGIDADTGDGQGCDNGQRKIQANRLLVFIQNRKTAAGDPDVLSMGDYNAYGEEDPIFILEDDASDTLADGAGGLISQSKRFVPLVERYSFQFDAMFGDLDHALATKSINPQISGATIWHVNADEPTVIDYNTEFKTQDLYTPTPFRASDHDPFLIGLNLTSAAAPQGQLVISEFRFRGPGSVAATTAAAAARSKSSPALTRLSTKSALSVADTSPEANNEFIEFYNNTESDITVSTTDGSAGWALVASDGVARFTIPNNTVIPARGHYLATNSLGYSLGGYPSGNDGVSETTATGDITYNVDIPSQAGIALFNTANPANFVTENRLDAVGYSAAAQLYREGSGFNSGAAGGETSLSLEYSFYREMITGLPQDSNDNVADFRPVDTFATTTTIGARLGAPGPENLKSPVIRTSQVRSNLLDPQVGSTQPPNRVRKQCGDPTVEECDPSRSQFGTLSIRRTFKNTTSSNVTRLRFRVVDITTFPRPDANTADMRVLSSGNINVTVTGGGSVPVQGTTREEPPSQPVGGGWNTTLTAGTINLSNSLAPGASINLQFLLGVQQTGGFRFLVVVEALP